MALCVAYGFASAQAAIFSAAEAARFHTDERHMYPRPARLRLREATLQSALLRETFDRSPPQNAALQAAGGRRSKLADARVSGG